MANKTVKDFQFDPKFGFTGSAGKTHVKGYVRSPRKPSNDLAPRENLPQYNAVEQKQLIKRGEMAKGGAVRPAKVAKVMHEFKLGALHSGSKKGPKVTNRKQAVAIALSEARGAKKMADGGPVGMLNPMGTALGAPSRKLPRRMPAPQTFKRPVPAYNPRPLVSQYLKDGGRVEYPPGSYLDAVKDRTKEMFGLNGKKVEKKPAELPESVKKKAEDWSGMTTRKKVLDEVDNYREGGRVHDDRAADLKLIRSEIRKAKI